MTDAHKYTDIGALRTALVGRSVVSVLRREGEGDYSELGGRVSVGWVEGEVHLDDGTVLLLAGNDGCGGCLNGHYSLTLLNEMPINGIMDVQVVIEDGMPDRYSIFVLAQDTRIELAAFEGYDNGWYGTGFWFGVVAP
jgi:hypothetical protein